MRQWEVDDEQPDGSFIAHTTRIGPLDLFVTIEEDSWSWGLHTEYEEGSDDDPVCLFGSWNLARGGLSVEVVRAKAVAAAYAYIAGWLE